MASCPCGQRNSPEAGLEEVFAVPDSDFEENSSEEELKKKIPQRDIHQAKKTLKKGLKAMHLTHPLTTTNNNNHVELIVAMSDIFSLRH